MYKEIDTLIKKWKSVADVCQTDSRYETLNECATELENIVQTTKPLHAVGVSVLLSLNDGAILLGRRKNNTAAGLLSTPGGRLELGEDLS